MDQESPSAGARTDAAVGSTTAVAASSTSAESEVRRLLREILGPLLVGGRPHFDPPGAILVSDAEAIWTWLERDVVPELSAQARKALQQDGNPEILATFTKSLAAQIAEQLQFAQDEPDLLRRIRVQIGDEAAFAHLRHVASGFRCQPYLGKAVAFGRALDRQKDEQAVGLSLSSFPAKNSALMPMLMHAAMSQVSNPARIVTVVTRLSGGATERAITQSGFDTIIDAMTAHAQNQLSLIGDKGHFTDMDLVCRAILRLHAFIRGISIIVENDGHSRWAGRSAKLVAHISDQLAPRIQRVEADVRQALRPSRAGSGGIESDALLEALNGLYLLTTVREARDSFGVNSVLDSAWTQTGQVLETLISRNLEAYKMEPNDDEVARRLEAAIDMARIRFNPEYAEVIERAKEGALRRTSPEAASA